MTSPAERYVHGYHDREAERLDAQATALEDLIHGDTTYAAGTAVLEVGCGTGAQTVALARRSPGTQITAVDRSEASLAEARARIAAAGITNVEFRQADLLRLPFAPHSFDHVFVCFVLEHLSEPVVALTNLRRILKPGGTITVFEGDHGSALLYPASVAAAGVIACQAELQRRAGGNAFIGRSVYPLLVKAGFSRVHVSPRIASADASRPWCVDGITKQTFIAMMQGARESAIDSGILDAGSFDAGIRDLYRTTEADGTFSYTFFKGVAIAPEDG